MNATSPRPLVALYARYSSDLQRDASIDDQLRVCRERAAREGWSVVDTFTDSATSGATTLRPGYQAMLAALRGGNIDTVMAESLDRFSRDLEHIASFHKQCVFHQVRIVTLAEGEVSELHIGLKGTMGALYLKDLADKTKRGLEGRIHAGRCTGSPAYGYTVVRQLGDDGEVDRGLRAIDPARAATVRRIFAEYVGGTSPRRIAIALNAEGIPGPGGGIWYDSTIIGRPKRCDGLLRNELYVGRLVWRRRINLKDPISGSRLRRNADPSEILVKEVPQLRIVDDELWGRAQARMLASAAPMQQGPKAEMPAFWESRRPQHLLSGKVECGCCGRLFKSTGKDYMGCRAAKHGTCPNKRTIRRVDLETRVLDLLQRELMLPDLLDEFTEAFNAEADRLARELRAESVGRDRERSAIDRKIANLVDAIGDGRSSPAILAKLDDLEAQRAKLGASSEAAPHQAPILRTGMAEAYAEQVAALSNTLATNHNPEALEAARALIDKVIVSPSDTDGGPPSVELVGDLLALLELAGAGGTDASTKQSAANPVLDLFISSVKSGPGAEPLAFPTPPAAR